MMLTSHSKDAAVHVLLVRTGTFICALPAASVLETMRVLPVRPLAGVPIFVRGVSIIRGEAVPVVELASVLGASSSGVCTRFVVIRAGDRRVALEVESVLGVKVLNSSVCSDLPPLVSNARPEILTAIGALDQQLLLVLQGGAIVPREVWEALAEVGAVP